MKLPFLSCLEHTYYSQIECKLLMFGLLEGMFVYILRALSYHFPDKTPQILILLCSSLQDTLSHGTLILHHLLRRTV